MSLLTKLLTDGAVEVVSAKARTLAAVLSKQVVDRDGEVLVSKGVDLDAYRRNPIILVNHDHQSLRVARAVEVTPTRDSVDAVLQFAGLAEAHPMAETLWQLYSGKWMRAFSVGFRPHRATAEKLFPEQRGKTIWEWELYEASCVTIPSNPHALAKMVDGLRTKGLVALPGGARDDELGKVLGTVPLATYWDVVTQILPAPGADRKDRSMTIEKQDLEEIGDVFEKVTAPLLADNKALRDDLAALKTDLAAVKARGKGPPDDGAPQGWVLSDGRRIKLGNGLVEKLGGSRAPGVIRNRGEQPYSLMRAIRSVVDRDKDLAPFERSISEKLSAAGYQPSFGGIMVPLGGDLLWRSEGHEEAVDALAMEVKQAMPLDLDDDAVAQWRSVRKAMSSMEDNAGGSLIALPAQGEIIAALRDLSVIARAGARQVPLPPSGSIMYPAEGADVEFVYLGPNTPITPATPATGMVSLTARRAAAMILLPNDLVRYSANVAETYLRTSLAAKAALVEDKSAFEGPGGTLSPEGILNWTRSAANTPTAGVLTLFQGAGLGVNGNTFAATDPTLMMALVEEAPDPAGPTAFVMRSLLFAGIANQRADVLSTGDARGGFLFATTSGDLARAVPDTLRGLAVLKSTQISKTRTKGSGTGLTYIICGNFRNLLVGRYGAIEIATSNDYAFNADQMAVRAILRHDIAPSHASSFVLADQLIIPT